MSIYRYQETSPVSQAVFHHAKDRPPVALLMAGKNAEPGQLAAIAQAIRDAGWQAQPVYSQEKPVLQVSGFKKESELDEFLRHKNYVLNSAVVTAEPGDNAALSVHEHVGRNSLALAGAFNLVGSVGLIADGIRKRDHFRTAGGGLLTLGALSLMRYGSAKSGYYTRKVAEDLVAYVREQGGNLPESGNLADIERDRRDGPWAKAEHQLHSQPAENALILSGSGAAALLISGARSVSKDKKAWGMLGFGLSSLGLKLAALLIPEKPKNEDKHAQAADRNAVQKAVDWVREKPLRVYGYTSFITDMFIGFDTLQQYRKNPAGKGYAFTAAATACYTIADIMMAISSKDHVNTDGKFDPDEQRGIVALAGEAVAVQPEAARAPLAEKLARFLSSRREMRGDTTAIRQSILNHASREQENPWADRVQKDAAIASARS